MFYFQILPDGNLVDKLAENPRKQVGDDSDSDDEEFIEGVLNTLATRTTRKIATPRSHRKTRAVARASIHDIDDDSDNNIFTTSQKTSCPSHRRRTKPTLTSPAPQVTFSTPSIVNSTPT